MTTQLDYYAVLEVDPESDAAGIRKAYFQLAKQLHPDRQASADPERTERFLQVQRAYEILMDPAKREDYDRQRITASSPVPSSDTPARAKTEAQRRWAQRPSLEEERDARKAYEKAVIVLENEDPERALRAMQAVVRAIPDNPEYASFLGYLMALGGSRLHAARDYCKQAVEAEPYNSEFHARLGFVYERAGLPKVAEQAFDEALRIDPHQALALEHASKGRRTKKTGILSRLFGG